ncbi:MAG: 30S ribosomal protein S20 [Pirellulaceae bacterium]|nr:30S ribosomal protein S20 [Pirellulaceae bacterium]
MPNIKSAKKRLKQSVGLRQRNRAEKSAIKTECKKVLAAVEDGNAELAETVFRKTSKKVDKAASKKVIHRNAAARVKSRLSAKIKKIKGK